MKKKIVMSVIACLILAICICGLLIKPWAKDEGKITIIIENKVVIVSEEVSYVKKDTLSDILKKKYDAQIDGGFIYKIRGINPNSEAHEYIAFYVNGEYSKVGVNDAVLEQNSIYRFVLETW